MTRRKKIIPKEPFTANVTALSYEGRGIARINDKIVFIFGALPEETVTAQYTYCHKRFDEAITVAVNKSAPERIVAKCEHFGVCGGCQLQHLSAAKQVEYKQQFLQDLLENQAKISPKAWLAPLIGPAFHYRQKARLGVRYVEKKEALLIGFREQKNNKIAMINSCQVLDARIGEKISELKKLLFGLKGRTEIAQIEVAATASAVALIFRHLQPLLGEDQQQLIQFCQEHHFSLYLQPGGIDTIHKVWPADGCNTLSYVLHDQQLTFHFKPSDFTQVNQQMNQQMINQALALLAPSDSDRILDLFCGLGNFSLPLAQKAAEVVGVEGSEEMVARASLNAKLNGLTNVTFYSHDLAGDFSKAPWKDQNYNKMLLDPPRSGAQNIVENIKQFNVKTILYISCNPATFTRDAAILVHQQGYQLQKVGVMDMFPQTAHVETMGLFTTA